MTRAPTGHGPALAAFCRRFVRTLVCMPGTLSCSLICSLILGALPLGSARAASGLVVLIEPSVATSGERRCLTRIREELLAGGFEVALVDPGPSADPISIAGAIQRQRGSVATIALLGDPELGPSELWILDRVGEQPEVRRIAAPTDDPAHVPEVLAIRTIELLRASALKLLVESNRPPVVVAAAPTPVVVPPSPPPEPPPALGLEVGLALLESLGGPGPAALPTARLRLALRAPLFVGLTLAGLGSRPRVTTSQGSADVAQDLGLVEVGLAFRRQRRVSPFITLGGGALHVGSAGAGIYPYRGIDDSRWAGLVEGGVGLAVAFDGRLAMAFELQAALAAPHPVVRFSGADAATIGRPALIATWTLMTWL
ncbi:MAG TPA: hypothetical protein VFG23_06910 [Polyangia bacterium]|nr:hypothetical protein [Polyangia bacterium]